MSLNFFSSQTTMPVSKFCLDAEPHPPLARHPHNIFEALQSELKNNLNQTFFDNLGLGPGWLKLR